MKTQEEELCKVRKKLKYVCNRLRFEYKCQKMKLPNSNSHYEQMGKNGNFDQEILPSKFKTVCEKLRETKIAYDEAKNMIQNDVSNIKNTVLAIVKLSEGKENNQYKDLALQVQKLKEINCLKDEELRRMNKKIKDLERENECNALKIDKHRNRLLVSKWINENKPLFDVNSEQTIQNHNNSICKKIVTK